MVRDSAGGISIDLSGRKNGRGAYLCRDLMCWTKALKGKQLEHSLRTSISQDDRKVLETAGKDLLSGGS